MIVLSEGPGRTRTYRGKSGFVVPDDFTYGVCDWCKTEYMSQKEILALGAVFEKQHSQDKLKELFNRIIELPLEEQTYILIELVKSLDTWNVDLVKKSKFLSLVLRHNPAKIGIEMDDNGWVKVSDLCRLMPISKAELSEIVSTDSKGRYSFSPDTLRIRANQGHSIKVDVQMVEIEPPEFLYHGTATKSLDGIMDKGILPMSRQFVHLSLDEETAIKVGSRHGKPIILKVLSKDMALQGHKFWRSENEVWQVLHVPPNFIQILG